MNKYIKTLVIVTFFTILGCNNDEIDYLNDPNAISTDQLNVDYITNTIQLNFNSFMIGRLNFEGRKYTRMEYQWGNYFTAPIYFDSAWEDYYVGVLKHVRKMTPLAQSQGRLNHVGISQVLEVMATLTMVDFFGDIPYSEAINENILHPKADSSQSIYASMLLLLDDAILNLSETPSSNLQIQTDLYYAGDMAKWIKLANTLKLKIYIQTKNVNSGLSASKINEIITEGNFIDEISEDFQFKYGRNESNPDTRHPFYSSNYAGGGADNYLSNSFMYELKSNSDPRLRYYFFRQNTSAPNEDELVGDLVFNPPLTYNYIGDGYRGRDHGIEGGIPDDALKRTTWGLYPAGGIFDANQPHAGEYGEGAGGEGINPILLSSYVKFMIAEAGLTISGVSADPLTYYQQGIELSIQKVMSFGNLNGVQLSSLEPSETQVQSYLTNQINKFNNATSTNTKMNVLMTQYWIAAFGNGIETYINYKRTGFPDLQTPLVTGAVFPRSVLYPSSYVNYNMNAHQHEITNQVFWDTNPAGFID